MPDIYDILAKHFLNEASENEEKLIDSFSKEKPLEYSMLKKLWHEGNINVKDFDSNRAWLKMQQKILDRRQARVLRMQTYKKLLRIAAVAAILIIGAFSVYYFTAVLPGRQVVTAMAGNSERGKKIVLSDGTTVWLNKNSTLVYTRKFTGNERRVKLTGEAFLKVHHNVAKPFIITTTNASVKVLGTSFNVKNIQGKTDVVVATGKVKVSNSAGNIDVVITPGMSATVSGELVIKYKNKDPNYLAWRTGEFTFNNTPLDKVFNDLNTYYDNRFVYDGAQLPECKLTAEFRKADAESIIETIKLICDIEIIQKDGKYIVRK